MLPAESVTLVVLVPAVTTSTIKRFPLVTAEVSVTDSLGTDAQQMLAAAPWTKAGVVGDPIRATLNALPSPSSGVRDAKRLENPGVFMGEGEVSCVRGLDDVEVAPVARDDVDEVGNAVLNEPDFGLPGIFVAPFGGGRYWEALPRRAIGFRYVGAIETGAGIFMPATGPKADTFSDCPPYKATIAIVNARVAAVLTGQTN